MSPTPEDWTPHRRDDGELLGWIRPEADLWVPVDLFGRDRGAATEWLDAEEVLEARGLAWLADPWILEREGGDAVQVRVVEVSADRVVVKTDDFGAIDVPYELITLPWPVPTTLRPRRPGESASPFA